MDTSVDQEEAKAQSRTFRPAKLLKIIDTLQNWMLGPFLLTEQEKEEAGIYIGRMGEYD